MVRLIPLRLALTVVFLLTSVLAAVAFVATGDLAHTTFDVIGLGDAAVDTWAYAKFPVLGLVVVSMIALLYRTAPNVERKFRIISLGGAIGLLTVIVASAAFGAYVANFGSYNKTYGALAFVPLFLTWLWIINMALLFGAEVDAATYKQRRMADEDVGRASQNEPGRPEMTDETDTEDREQTEAEANETEVEASETEDRGQSEKSDEEQRQDKKDEEAKDEEEIDKIMAEVEENPPDKLEDWPGGKAKYRTIGGSGDANEAWEDGPTEKLGPADLVHHEGGDVSIGGEKVDNPEDYKGEPIPGGPTDPNAPDDPAGLADESDDDDGDDEGDGDSSFQDKAKTDEDAIGDDDSGEQNA
jgi:hypothetical protein